MSSFPVRRLMVLFSSGSQKVDSRFTGFLSIHEKHTICPYCRHFHSPLLHFSTSSSSTLGKCLRLCRVVPTALKPFTSSFSNSFTEVKKPSIPTRCQQRSCRLARATGFHWRAHFHVPEERDCRQCSNRA